MGATGSRVPVQSAGKTALSTHFSGDPSSPFYHNSLDIARKQRRGGPKCSLPEPTDFPEPKVPKEFRIERFVLVIDRRRSPKRQVSLRAIDGLPHFEEVIGRDGGNRNGESLGQ